jgi:hypothetical protein
MPMHVGSMAIFRLPDDYQGDFFEEFKAFAPPEELKSVAN